MGSIYQFPTQKSFKQMILDVAERELEGFDHSISAPIMDDVRGICEFLLKPIPAFSVPLVNSDFSEEQIIRIEEVVDKASEHCLNSFHERVRDFLVFTVRRRLKEAGF